MTEPRLCLAGTGQLASRRILPYIGAAGAQLVGSCDIDYPKAERASRLFGGRPYSDFVQMLEAESPDGVIICIGPEMHASLGAIALQRSIPVYTEKPPAPTSEIALQLARLSVERGVLCTTGFKKRYSIANNRAKDWLASFAPSDLYSISIDYAGPQYTNDSLSTSFLHDFCIHVIDLVAYLFGEVEQVFAFAKGKDAYAVSLKFRSGAVGSLNLNDGRTITIPTEEIEISIRGGNFMTIHNSSSWRITQDGQASEWREPPTFVAAGDSGFETGMLAEIVDFVEAVRDNRTTRSNIYESYKSLVLYEAIRDSAESGRVISVNYTRI